MATPTPTPISAADALLLQGLCNGQSNKQIALALSKSELTVRNQLSQVFKKIGAVNRTQAAAWFQIHLAQQTGPHAGIHTLTVGSKSHATAANHAKAELPQSQLDTDRRVGTRRSTDRAR